MAYKVIILYRLYMPSYFLGTFTEYPYRKAVTPHVYTNIKNVLSFREARNLGVKILTARHSDIE